MSCGAAAPAPVVDTTRTPGRRGDRACRETLDAESVVEHACRFLSLLPRWRGCGPARVERALAGDRTRLSLECAAIAISQRVVARWAHRRSATRAREPRRKFFQ